MTKWENHGDFISYMHILDDGTDMHHVYSLKRETEVTHEFLLVLAKLGVIAYERGYDGIYYEVIVSKRK